MSPASGKDGSGQKPSGVRREVFDEAGCSVCGIQTSSSFRNNPETGCRLCNSCHCKTYRLKRKAAGLTGPSAVAKLRAQVLHGSGSGGSPARQSPAAAHRQAMRAMGGADTPESGGGSGAAARWCLPLEADGSGGGGGGSSGHHHQQQQEQQDPPHLSDLQRRVLEASGGSPAELAATLHCASRAQLATPFCAQRAVLGVLPLIDLQLPEDPAGMKHTISCLIEAVLPGAPAAAEQGGDSQGDDLACGRQGQGRGERSRGGGGTSQVSIRLTVFAAAGAVACWHEAPADASMTLGFSPITKAPVWTSGPGGFSLHFPGPFCPQVDLFAAIHHHVVGYGCSALSQPVLSLSPNTWQLYPMCGAHSPTAPQQVARQHSPGNGGGIHASAAQQRQQQRQHRDGGELAPHLGAELAPPHLEEGLQLPTLSFCPVPSGPLFDIPSLPMLF